MTVTDNVRANARPAVHTRPGRMEFVPILGMLGREWVLYKRTWAPITFAAIVEPVIMLLAFGIGLGTLIGAIGGYDYIEFLGTGIVATAVLFTSMFPGLIDTFVRREFRKSYEGVLAAPVDVREMVTADALWIALKAGVYGCAPLLVAIGFGLPPTPWMLLVPFIGFITAMGFALLGIFLSAVIPSIRMVDYVISGFITPVYLLAGTFFPLDQFPQWLQYLTLFNPLYHCVELVRGTAFGIAPLTAAGHVLAILVFCVVTWLLAVWQMRRRLID
ncbi:ABC transporter permease [Spiractinospora alimapuensis]|uniref:ABC transporter permease n=1 Tax=Spiractinospora alimapuensis TaxID=2820884 RepID=UPI001F187000|nr:ABC transporter permease [Spiractinospora alimapuensis]QVQ51450.1 ABC transporter permease [Spiractinospora alimapuensis]